MLEKFKQIITKAESFILGSDSKNQTSKEENFFGDSFKKKTQNEAIYASKVSKVVWVKGQAFNVVAESEEEIKNKVKNLSPKLASDSENIIDTNKYIFSNLYTQQREIKENEWVNKRDVWVNEYCPA
ncbi:MAG: hypothetical protein AABZ74_13655 [Cyanobacteriota bacterium]